MTNDPTKHRALEFWMFCGTCREGFTVPREEVPDDGRIWQCAKCSTTTKENP